MNVFHKTKNRTTIRSSNSTPGYISKNKTKIKIVIQKYTSTPVFLLRESQGQGSLVGCRLWGHTESDTTEVT